MGRFPSPPFLLLPGLPHIDSYIFRRIISILAVFPILFLGIFMFKYTICSDRVVSSRPTAGQQIDLLGERKDERRPPSIMLCTRTRRGGKWYKRDEKLSLTIKNPTELIHFRTECSLFSAAKSLKDFRPTALNFQVMLISCVSVSADCPEDERFEGCRLRV